MSAASRRLLVTHGSGYVGSRLVRALCARGEQVRCLARRPGELYAGAPPGVEVMPGDMLDPVAVEQAVQGVHTVVYLAHSMDMTGHVQEQDRRAAESMARAAERAGVRRIVYLGALASSTALSPHVAARVEVGRVFRKSQVPTLELRAPNVIGVGSVPFEMLRGIVRHQPLLVAHSWLLRPVQPIAVDDLVAYLLAAIDVRVTGSVVVEVGGRDRVTYRQLMEEYARQCGLRRLFLPMFLTAPRLSSIVLGALTPLSARVARRLIDSLRSEAVVASPLAGELFPEIRPMGMAAMLADARAHEARASRPWWRKPPVQGWRLRRGSAPDPGPGGRPPAVRAGHGARTRRIDARSLQVPVPPALAFEPIRCIGGDRGWYYGGWLWLLRGDLDRLVGGPGLRRGRRSPAELARGDALDFWRVDAFEPDRLLRLKAEMRVPGRAWLQFDVQPTDDGGSRITQQAMFDPDGVLGVLYWYALLPLHGFIFAGMLRRIGARAVAGNGVSPPGDGPHGGGPR